MKLNYYLDQVLEAYSKGEYYEEVKRAKDEFFSRVGQVAEGSENFESQMKAFLDWYLFDRPLSKSEVCPVKMFIFDFINNLPENDRSIFQDLAKSTHSLFELLKVKGSDVYVKDLFNSENYIVEDSDVNAGFSKGDIFEGRLIQFKDKLVFGSSFVFHPKECRSFIIKEIKKIRTLDPRNHLRLMHRLAMMKMKCEQYSHIDVKNIYSETPLF
jgi:hypothetical protein